MPLCLLDKKTKEVAPVVSSVWAFLKDASRRSASIVLKACSMSLGGFIAFWCFRCHSNNSGLAAGLIYRGTTAALVHTARNQAARSVVQDGLL